MKIGFPRLGSFHVSLEPAFRPVGLRLIAAPPSSRRTLDLGLKYNQEMICTPCKLLFGNYVEALEGGAEVLIMLGGPGTCRLGYSARIQEALLRQMGFDFRAYPADLYRLPAELIHFLRTVGNLSWPELIETVRYLLALIELVDEVEREMLRLRPLEQEPGRAERLREEALARIAALPDRTTLNSLREELLSAFQTIPCRARQPLQVALVGDLYTMLEPFFNMHLEQEAGRLGIHVQRSFWPSDMLGNMLQERLGRGHNVQKLKAAEPYLTRDIGGFARNTVGEAALFAQGGVDGLIHLAPFNCSPEVMAHNALISLQRQEGVPILSLSFDEHTGRAGLLTRLEAFTDLLERRRERLPPPPPPPHWAQRVARPLSVLMQDMGSRLNEAMALLLKESLTHESDKE